ncbi:hypothetical protein CFIMG_005861RAa [Ceratocystis fimbriata CBS 114723]|uniref:5'-3' DNA helicase ZGRF1-like N-terminal domain-containing protein n=1 Tax=Ceratocystis fimbriata CBS 114723 TaxID=1035309 RepID=A0A2C5WU57_9PEZI|nr:hypothetical protein CFIMG_005861RAa [Ceratocystis fimbriata CBS 114723]
MNRASQSPESPIAGPTPSRPIMAPVIEFSCLFSHDLKRKQKRWKDGRLKFHTFNKRVMVYDDRGNSVGDMHWQEHLIFQEGEEIYLDRGGVVVQVCECKGYKEQDLTELLTRRHRATAPPPESTAATPLQNRGSRRAPATSFNPPRSVPPALHDTPESSQIIHGASRPSCFQTPSRGPIGRAIIPRSPFEERRAQLVASSQPLAAAAVAPTDAPPAKRQRQNGGAQKSTYATSLFGAALNLSTAPSRSTPVRQAIPRLHSINPDAQLSSSVTSLRTSYRDTRSRNSPICEQEDMGAQVPCKGKGKDFVQKRDGLAIRRDTTPLMCAGTLDLVPTRDDDICIAHSILSNQAQSDISQSPPKSPPQAREILPQPSPLSSPSSTPFMNTPYKTCLHPLTNAIVLPPHNTSSTSSESTTAPVTLEQKSEEAHTRGASLDSTQKLPKIPLPQVSSPSLKLQVDGICGTSPNSTSHAPSPIQYRSSPSHCSLLSHKKSVSHLEAPFFETSQPSLSLNDMHSSSPVSPLSPPTLLLPDAFRRPERPSSLLQSRSPAPSDDVIDVQGAQSSIKTPCQLDPQQSSLGDDFFGLDMELDLDPSPMSLYPAPAINSGVEGPSIKNHSASPDIPVTAPLPPVITSNASRILPEKSCSGGTLKVWHKANLDLASNSASQDPICSVISGSSSGTTDTLHKPLIKGQLIPEDSPPSERNIISTNACDKEAASESQAPTLPRFRIPSFLNKSNSKPQQPQQNMRADSNGPSIITAITEGALQTHGCSIMPTSNLGVNRRASLLRMGGFTRPEISSVVQLREDHEGMDRGQYQKPGQDGQREEDVDVPGEKPTLPPVRRFPGLTRASGDPWSREAHDLFEWTRPAT